jgi:hypothetical protein
MYFHDYMNNNANENDCISLDSKLKASNGFKIEDKNRVKIVKSVNAKWNDGKYYKNVEIELFGTGYIGSRIRNAVSGARTRSLVGSKDENMFFQVADCTGFDGRREPLNLYYDSPEQYENHFFVNLEQHVKEAWHRRFLDRHV